MGRVNRVDAGRGSSRGACGALGALGRVVFLMCVVAVVGAPNARGATMYLSEQTNGLFTVSSTGVVTPFAKLHNSLGLTFDGVGNLFVVNGYEVGRVASDGTYTFIAKGDIGYDLVVDRSGNLYTEDRNGISKITPDGMMSHFATLPKSTRNILSGLAIDASDTLYAGVEGGVYKVTSDGEAALFASLPMKKSPEALAMDPMGNLYASDIELSRIFKITSDGTASKFASSPFLNVPWGLTCDEVGNLYVVNSGNNEIRMFVTANSAGTSYASRLEHASYIAFAPVPEPSSLMMFLGGAGVLLFRRRGRVRMS